MTKEDCIEKICLIPFELENRSAFDLCMESDFLIHHKEVTVENIKEYLLRFPDLIKSWDIWSANKRTNHGFYFVSDNSKSKVGYINLSGKETFKKTFDSPVDACAEFILKEISSILNK